eukprot:528198_1
MASKLNERDKKMILQIFQNILQHPNNDKFKNLNLNRIGKLFSNQQICLQYLYDAGFYKSNDERRLLHDKTKLNQLKQINQRVLCINLESITNRNYQRLDQLISNFNSSPVSNSHVHDSFYLLNSQNIYSQMSNKLCLLRL